MGKFLIGILGIGIGIGYLVSGKRGILVLVTWYRANVKSRMVENYLYGFLLYDRIGFKNRYDSSTQNYLLTFTEIVKEP